jgi:hypothetical protein
MRESRNATLLLIALATSFLLARSADAFPLQLVNGWTHAPFSTSNAEVFIEDGIVHFKGAIAQGTSGLAFTLPFAVRPEATVHVAVDLCVAQKGRLVIQPNGQTTVEAPAGAFGSAQCFTSLDGARFAKSALGFTELTLQNGWTSGALGTHAPAAALINGIVHLQGGISGGSSASAFTLPPALRPATDVYVPISLCGAEKGRLHIRSSGVVTIDPFAAGAAAQCFTSLDGASFAPSATGFTQLTLVNGWTHAPFSTSPAAAALIDGVAYFKGAIEQGTTGPAFTLPSELLPSTYVYVPVDLCNATKGRLIIAPNGEVTIQAFGPFGDAQCFTSLDGASFIPSTEGFIERPLPFHEPMVLLTDTSPRVFTIDLGTLPTRPILVVEASLDPSHSDVLLSIEITDWLFPTSHPGTSCPGPTNSTFGDGVGSATASRSLIGCDPVPGAFAGSTVKVKVSVLDFGFVGPPATVDLRVRGDTQPPISTLSVEVDTNLGPRQVVLPAVADTVLYSDFTDHSNGQGDFLWAAIKSLGIGNPSAHRNALIAFDVTSFVSPVAQVDYVELLLDVVGIAPAVGFQAPLQVRRVATNPTYDWLEGCADAPGNEFDGATSSSCGAADWFRRQGPFDQFSAWSIPGGDPLDPPLVDTTIASLGVFSLSTTELRDAVQDMATNGGDDEGFVLSRPPGGIFSFSQEGLQIASRESSSTTPPTLVVDYTLNGIYTEGNITTGVVSFISEGQNFRWIYDLDDDDVLTTDVGGICEVRDTFLPNQLPYTYQFQGQPGFTGVDCCAWHIDSPQTGTIGTGQALFFHNLDPDVAMPPDSDLDGIRDLCDNCPSTPNGPLLGTCVIGVSIGANCRSNQQCGFGGRCDLSQIDIARDGSGEACPEPGFAVGLGAALVSLTSLAQARSTRTRRSAANARRDGPPGRPDPLNAAADFRP